jgi:hypothetical protein
MLIEAILSPSWLKVMLVYPLSAPPFSTFKI